MSKPAKCLNPQTHNAAPGSKEFPMRRVFLSLCALVLGLSCVPSVSAQVETIPGFSLDRAKLNAARFGQTRKPRDLAVTAIGAQQQGGLTVVSVTVENKGGIPSINCTLHLDVLPKGQKPLGQTLTIPSIGGGRTQTFTFSFQGPAQGLTVDALVDPQNVNGEIQANRSNNALSRTFP
jgi:CARDB protein